MSSTSFTSDTRIWSMTHLMCPRRSCPQGPAPWTRRWTAARADPWGRDWTCRSASPDSSRTQLKKIVLLEFPWSFLLFFFANSLAETLTAAEFKKTVVTIQRKSGELHPLADYGDVASAKGFNQSDLQTFCNILYILLWCILIQSNQIMS